VLLPLAAVLGGLAGCTQESIVAVDPDVPGTTVPTVEISALASDLFGWRDTTFIGFELPATSSLKILADRDDLASRVLGRFDIPDSIVTQFGSQQIDRFVEAEFRVLLSFEEDPDSVAVPDYRLEVFTLEQRYDSLEATWVEREGNVTWETPGGALGPLLASGDFPTAVETAVLPLSGPVDDLLQFWRETEGEPGVALVLRGGGPEFFVSGFELATEVTVVGRSDTIPAVFDGRATTFIYDPPQPSPDRSLRIAGLPSARIYLQFTLPDTLGGVLLSGATINHAELQFRPLAAPDPPFTLERDIATSVLEVAADAFAVGPKVPVGPPIPNPLTNAAQFITISPEGLADGEPLRANITALVSRVANFDTLTQVRVAIRPVPSDAQAFGFWEFGSVESELALRPRLFMLVTPSTRFPVP
jgi:hypothetical protein